VPWEPRRWPRPVAIRTLRIGRSVEFTLRLSNADNASTVPQRSDSWRFLTNHARVLACLFGDPEVRLRDIAQRVGVTERAVHDLVGDLERGGYIRVRRVGRRNQYEVCGVGSSGEPAGLGSLGLIGLLAAELDETVLPGGDEAR
jgi:Winged helix-turn-helix DNA-binding